MAASFSVPVNLCVTANSWVAVSFWKWWAAVMIVEQGSHDELLRHDGLYADFWSITLLGSRAE
jgi:hypothetical protein